MTTKKGLLLTASVMLLLASCSKDIAIEDNGTALQHEISMKIEFKGLSGYATSSAENEIRNIDVLSFVKFHGSTDYVFEEQTSVALPDPEQPGFTFKRTGSLPRIVYFITNGPTKSSMFSVLDELKPTAEEFESISTIRSNSALTLPLTMVGKVELPTPQSTAELAVTLSHTAACLTIDNRYAGFTIDSLVIRDVVSGAFLFKSDTPSAAEMRRLNINYGTQNTLYLYQTDTATLAVYGKYQGIRAVFDIPLRMIKSGTRYKVTFRSKNDSTVDFVSNLQYNVAPWTNGATVDSTPDWK